MTDHAKLVAVDTFKANPSEIVYALTTVLDTLKLAKKWHDNNPYQTFPAVEHIIPYGERAIEALRALQAENEKRRKEPVLPSELVDEANGDCDETKWSIKALKELARQLGHGNDFYFPLIGAVQLLEKKDREFASLKARAVPTLEPQHIELVMKEMRVSGTVNVIRWWRAFQNAINATGEKK